MLVPVPSSLAEHVKARGKDIAPPSDASTVVLVRDGDEGIEAYMMRRQRSMKFAPGMVVFPGGRVDAADTNLDVPWVGDPPSVWASRFDCDERTARGLVCAAVRETFEESGVLLAGRDEHSVIDDTSHPDWQKMRLELEAHEYSFAEFLERTGLVLRADLLGAWSHWVTPTFEPRRFDTRFFVAVLPAGQRVGELAGEADHAEWLPLGRVIASADAGETAMLPPTRVTCGELAELSADSVLAAALERRIITVMPELVEVDGQQFLHSDLGDGNE